MASPSSQGRRRTPGKSTTEDQALNVIASEAEARLAAKRAARAEARIIRMKELERMQQEADEKMDREYQRSLITEDPIKQRASRATEKLQSRAAPLNDTEMNGPASQDTQIRSLQDNLREVNEKYKKAMVSNAQLDNEKQALAYQVDCLKDRIEEAEEVIENLRQEIIDKTRDINRLSRENKNHIEELEKTREQLILRDKLLEEHGIPTDGSEQPDISQTELANRMTDSVNLESTEFDASAGIRSRDSSRRSSAPDDRDSLLEQIKVLKEQVSDLRRNPDFDDDRMKDFESLQTSDDRVEQISTAGVAELEKSEAFEDVTDEAIEIRDRLRSGMVVNNNERNEDYDVIEQNARQGELPNFEDRSFEMSSGLTDSVTESATGSMLESYRSQQIGESCESENPLEISAPVEIGTSVNVDETPVLTIPGAQEAGKDLTDYDIVETTTSSRKITKSADVSHESEDLSIANRLVGSTEELEVKTEVQPDNGEEGLVADDVQAKSEEMTSDMVDVSCETQELFVAEHASINRIMAFDEAAGSDIVEIELPDALVSDDQEGNECFEELDETFVPFSDSSIAATEVQLESEASPGLSDSTPVVPHASEMLVTNHDSIIMVGDEGQDIVDISFAKNIAVDDSETYNVTSGEKLSEDEDGFDNIESDDIFVDAKSDLSDGSIASETKMEENANEILEGNVDRNHSCGEEEDDFVMPDEEKEHFEESEEKATASDNSESAGLASGLHAETETEATSPGEASSEVEHEPKVAYSSEIKSQAETEMEAASPEEASNEVEHEPEAANPDELKSQTETEIETTSLEEASSEVEHEPEVDNPSETETASLGEFSSKIEQVANSDESKGQIDNEAEVSSQRAYDIQDEPKEAASNPPESTEHLNDRSQLEEDLSAHREATPSDNVCETDNNGVDAFIASNEARQDEERSGSVDEKVESSGEVQEASSSTAIIDSNASRDTSRKEERELDWGIDVQRGDESTEEEAAAEDLSAECGVTENEGSKNEASERMTPDKQGSVCLPNVDSNEGISNDAKDRADESASGVSALKDEVTEDHAAKAVSESEPEINTMSKGVKEEAEGASPLPHIEATEAPDLALVESSIEEKDSDLSTDGKSFDAPIFKIENESVPGGGEQLGENGQIHVGSTDTEEKGTIVLPEKDYPLEEIHDAEESAPEKSPENVRDEGGDTAAAGNASQDQLITVFETRKRMGSLSPGSLRKQVSPEPVPKERKKKKKKKAKGSVMKMFVQELASTSFDSGSGSEAAEQSESAEQPESAEQAGREGAVLVEDTASAEDTASVEDLESIDDVLGDTEGSGLPVAASSDVDVQSREDAISQVEANSAWETSDAEAGAKGKSKDKSKSKKDSKKDGCKSQ